MINRLSFLVVLILAFAVPATSQQVNSTEKANKETIAALDVLDSITKQTASILAGESINETTLDTYKATARSFAKYSDSRVILGETDRALVVKGFYDFLLAGGEPMSMEELREDLSRFSTLGEVVGYLSQALLAGIEDGEES